MNQSTYPASLSFWEIKQYLQDIDLMVIGSGIVGLTSAIFFKKLNPKAKVVVVEKGTLPSGASTKNAGFACFGSPSEILADLQSSTETEVFETMRKRIDGLKALRELLGDEAIGFEPCGGYELFRSGDAALFASCNDQIDFLNRETQHVSGLPSTYSIADKELVNFGFDGIEHAIFNQHEGSIDTGKMMDSLILIAQKMNISILNSLEVSGFEFNHSGVDVAFSNGWNVRCGHLHVATNGFASKLLPELDVKPARAQVLITSPIPNLKVKGTFHMEEGFYYFRNVGERLLFGGGRQLNFEKETTSKIGTTELIQNDLEQKLRTIILPNSEYQIEHRWAGIMGVGAKKTALVKRVSDRVTCAVRMGGMGVAIGTSIGKESAELIG